MVHGNSVWWPGGATVVVMMSRNRPTKNIQGRFWCLAVGIFPVNFKDFLFKKALFAFPRTPWWHPSSENQSWSCGHDLGLNADEQARAYTSVPNSDLYNRPTHYWETWFAAFFSSMPSTTKSIGLNRQMVGLHTNRHLHAWLPGVHSMLSYLCLFLTKAHVPRKSWHENPQMRKLPVAIFWFRSSRPSSRPISNR